MRELPSIDKKSIVCNNCGKCCYFVVNGVKIKCKYLIRISKNITQCRIYNNPNRVGTKIYAGIFCNHIENVPQKYDGCPYNILKN